MYRVTRVEDLKTLQQAREIRTRVFIEEQGVPPAIEHDGRDGECIHVVAWCDNTVVGTARMSPVEEGQKIGRMAVLPQHRSKGVGGMLLNTLRQIADSEGYAKVVLHAQVHAVPFYERYGFVVTSPEFVEAGIKHVCMEANSAPDVRPCEVAQD